MSTSDHGSRSAARHAASADPATGGAPQPDAGASDATSATTPPGRSVTGAPDDIQELRQEIEQTRKQLGRTVQQLAVKTDVKAQARHKAVELAQRGKAKGSQTRARAAAIGAPVWEATPERVRQAVAKGASAVWQRRASLAVTASALVAGYLVVRKWRR